MYQIKRPCFISSRIQKKAETATDSDYPSYGVTGPNTSGNKISPSSTMSDRKLAQSAQMFHYQQQRQQMMAQEKYILFRNICHYLFLIELISMLNQFIQMIQMMKHLQVEIIQYMNVLVSLQYVDRIIDF
jgi:hypothetical protein